MVRKLIRSIFFKKVEKGNVIIDSTVKIFDGVKIDASCGGEVRIDKQSELLYGVIIMPYGGKIEIGERCSINPYTILYGHGGLKIGNNVLIAGHTVIIPANHNFEDLSTPINSQGETRKGIVIEDNVWIGAGCRILDGVTIETGAIVAAGAVVNKDVPSNTIVGGIPAKFIRKR